MNKNISFICFSLLLLAAGLCHGQYVWNGTDGTAYEYAGTTNPPWASDTTKTGKWITGGANATITNSSGYLTIDAGTLSLTVEGATVSSPSDKRTYINSSLTINNKGVFNVNGGLWMASNNATSYLTVNSGGTLNISGASSYIADSKNGHAIIDVNGGTISAKSAVQLGHHGALTATVRNGGTFTSTTGLTVGAGDAGSSTTNIPAARTLTIGTAGSSTDNSLVKVSTLTIGNNANAAVVLESGTLQTMGALTIGSYQDGTLNVNGGTLTVGGNITVGANAGSNYDATTGYTDSVIRNAQVNFSNVLNVNNGYLTFDAVNDLTLSGLQINSGSSAKLTLMNTKLTANYATTDTGLAIMTSSASETDQAELVVGAGAELSINGSYFWLSQNGNTRSKLTIQDGGVLKVNAESCLIDKSNSSGELVIDNGTYNATYSVRLGHRGYLQTEIKNGGKLTTTAEVQIGGGNNDASTGLLSDVTLGTEGIRDGSSMHSNANFYVGNNGKGNLTAYGATVTTGSDFVVGNGSATSGGVTAYGDGQLYAYDSTITATGGIYFGINANATVRIDDSTLTGARLNVGTGSTGSGNVEIVNSTLNIPSNVTLNLQRGSLTLNGTNYTCSSTSETVIGSSSPVDAALVVENATATFDGILRLRTTDSTGTAKASLIVNQGGTVNANKGLWMSNQANANSYVQVNEGGKLTLGATSYLGDNRTSVSSKIFVNGGLIESKELNCGWWGPMDIEIANGGQIKATGSITFGSNSGTDPASAKTGTLTISGADSLLSSTSDISFGNTTRDPVTVVLKASETGFGTIQAKNIYMNNGSFVFDATTPVILIDNYDSAKGVLLLNATNSLTNFGDAKTSLDWAATQTGNQVWAKKTTDYDAKINVDQTVLNLTEAKKTGWISITGSSDPFIMTIQLDGLTDLGQTEAFASELNGLFGNLSVEADAANLITISGFERNMTDALFAWNFPAVTGFENVAVKGMAGQSVPEPATWLLLISGLAGVFYCRRTLSSAKDVTKV